MSPKKQTILVAAALALGLGLSACGGDDDENNDDNNMMTDAGDMDAGDEDTGEMDAGDMDTGDMDAGDEDTGEMDAGDMDTGDMDAGDEDTGEMDTSDMDAGDMDADPGNGDLVIFDEALGADITFAPFGGSDNTIAPSMDEAFSGTMSLKASVPAAGYTGGAWVPAAAEDLSGFNALRFQVKASQAATLNVVGFGNTGEDTTQQVELPGVALTTDWQEVIVPIPDPALYDASSGLFHFAEGSDEGAYDIYFDDIVYTSVDPATFTNQAPAFATLSDTLVTGQTTTPAGTVLNLDIAGEPTAVQVQPFWFSWTSTDNSVAEPDANGVITAFSEGTASITGSLAGTDAGGQLDLTVIAGPTDPAPTPSTPAADVVASVYSNAYTNITVDTFRTTWSQASLTPLKIQGDDVLVYGGLDFAGIETVGPNSFDISSATTMHIDVWSPNAVRFGVKLVDFGANNSFDNGGADDSEHQLEFTSPDLITGQWISLDVPLADFVGLTSRANLSQIVLVGRIDNGTGAEVGGATVFVDNIYFY